MGTTKHLAETSKKILEEKGILSYPDAKPEKKISERSKSFIVAFYEDQKDRSIMPGMEDFVSVRDESGKRVHTQQKLVLMNLKELYEQFCEELGFVKSDPLEKVGFSKFASLRPKHCVLAGSSETHNVCVCSSHHNVKLMISSDDRLYNH